jgi:uncharacterized protein YkwD
MAWVFRRILVVALATTVMSLGLSVAPAFAGNESSLISQINAERTSRGKPALEVYWDLTDDARAQAKRMRDAQQVFHHPNLSGVTDADWNALAENVGVGGSVSGIMDAFMASSAHKANILNSSFNYVGAGVKEDANGILWVSVIFMAGPEGLNDPPDTTTTTTTTQPPSTTTTTTTTAPPSTTTTTSPGSTTTTLPPTDGAGGEGQGSKGGSFVGSQSSLRWILEYAEFEVLSPDWLNPALLRMTGWMGR